MPPFRILMVDAIHPYVEAETRYPSLGIGYLIAAVRSRLPREKIEFRVASRAVKKLAGRFRPDLVGITSVSQNFNIAQDYVRWFAANGVPVVLGGIHISSLPDCLPDEASLACLGEGEETFPEIVQSFLGGSVSPPDLLKIPGIALRTQNRLERSPDRPPVRDLDLLPMPARDLLDIRKHTYMFTSRGCPFRCAFCASSRYWDRLRFFSAEYVVDEIEMLARDYGVTMISFFDDLFAARLQRVEEIVRLLENRRLLGKLRFTCNCRPDIVTPDLVRLLSRLGVVSVGMGLESGDDAVLKFLKGDRAGVEQNENASRLLKDARIAANASFIIGSPYETRAQVLKTYDFIRRSSLDLFDTYLLTPFPGTPIWDFAKERRLVSDDMPDWSVLDVNLYRRPDKAVILSQTMTKGELIGLYGKFQRLRLRHNLVRVWRHPLRGRLPRMAWKLFSDFVMRSLRI